MLLTTLVRKYLSAWNEPDEIRRLAALETCWTPGGELIDPFDDQPAVGPAQISATIAEAQRERVPAGHRFALTSAVEAYGGILRYSWALVDENEDRVREGVDTGRSASDGRLLLMLSFVGLVPPPA